MTPYDQPIVCSVLIGRMLQLDSLRHCIDAAEDGRGAVAFISGEAGIGKSRLITEASAYAIAQGCLVLRGACFPPDSESPYALFVDLLRTQFMRRTVPDLGISPDPVAHELFQLLPGIVPLMPDLIASPSLDPEIHKRRLFAALTHFFVRYATQQPLVLVCEDLHWSDDASLAFLHYLIRQSADLPLILLATYRSEEAGLRLRHWLDLLDRERLTRAMMLDPLPYDDVASMLRTMFDLSRPVHAEFLDAIYRFTEGNPFFIEETVKSLIVAGDIFIDDRGWNRKAISELHIPQSVQDAVQWRVVSLSQAAQRVSAIASVVGRSVDFVLLQRLSELDEATLLEVIKELIAAQLMVEESAEQFTFRHALTRQAIYIGLLARERRTIHQAIADTLEHRAAESFDIAVADLAYHSYEAGMWDKALAYAEQAGEQARRLYAPRAATEHFTRAIEAARRLNRALPHLYRARGLAYETLGDFTRAQADHASALDLARAAHDQQAEWQTLLDLGLLWASRNYAQTGVYYQQALNLARAMGDPAVVAHSLNQIGNWHVNIEQPGNALRLHEEALAVFERLADQHGIAETLDLLGMAYSQAGEAYRAANAYGHAIRLFRILDDRFGLASALTTVALLGGSYFNDTIVPAAPDYTTFEQAGRESLQIARDIDWRAGQAYALFVLSGLAGIHGAYAYALECAHTSLATAEAIEHRQWMAAAHGMLGGLYHDLLALPAARQHCEQALALAQAAGSIFWVSIVTAQLARVCIDQGDVTTAAAMLDMLSLALPAQTFAQRQCWCARAELTLASDDPRTALELVDNLNQSAAAWTEQADIPRLAKLRGTALAALCQSADAEQALRHAEQGARAQGRTPLRWRIHAALGQLYLAERRGLDAEREFAAAHALVQELATTIADRPLRDTFVRGALAQLPLAPEQRRSVGQSLHDLTPREVDVLRLIAEAKSNQEIAAALVVSIRTVERHISTIYEKLGVSGRAARAATTAYALRHGLIPPNTH
jgi:predicted ATPase/DNA-binding CsgD family transcriptional regulator